MGCSGEFLDQSDSLLWNQNTKPNTMIASEIFTHSDRTGIEEGTTAMKFPNAWGLGPTVIGEPIIELVNELTTDTLSVVLLATYIFDPSGVNYIPTGPAASLL